MSNATGFVVAIAGSEGVAGSIGDNGVDATTALLNHPWGLVFDSRGHLYVSDNHNNVIRKMSSAGVGSYTITTVAGVMGHYGYNCTNDGGGIIATSCLLNRPRGLAVDKNDNIYIVDNGNNRIRMLKASNGKIITLVGNGDFGYAADGSIAVNGALNQPSDVALSGNDMYITDSGNHVIRKVKLQGVSPTISTIAGQRRAFYSYSYSGDGGGAMWAQLSYPMGISIRKSSGDVFFSDYYNYRIRRIDKDGTIFSYIGNGTTGLVLMNQISASTDICFDRNGYLVVADTSNHVIRRVNDKFGVVESDVVIFD